MLEELGVRRIINARGPLTILGGSTVDDEVLDAMREAAHVFVDMAELNARAGEYLARLIGVEAAYVTCGAAAGLVLSAEACMTRGEYSRIVSLPRTEGMRNEVLIQRLHRNMYDYNIELAGARLIEIGDANETPAEDLEAAIGEKTAAVLFNASRRDREGVLPLERVIEAAHRHGVPVIVDAASELPPAENLWRFARMGADLVVFSGGKDIGAPNNTGLVLGRKDLVKACMAIGPQSYEITNNQFVRVFAGRPLKTGKETIIGLVAAVKRYLSADQEKRMQRWEDMADYLKAELSRTGLATTRKVHGGLHPNPACIPKVEVEPVSSRVPAERLLNGLRSGDPPIHAYLLGGALCLDPHMLRDGEEKVIVSRLLELLAAAGNGEDQH